MRMGHRGRIFGAVLAILGLAASAHAAPQLAIDPTGYQLVSKIRINRITQAYTYRATVVNSGSDAWDVQGTVATTANGLRVSDSAVRFGPVPAGARVLSSDTFTVRQYRNHRVSTGVFGWGFASGPPFTFQVGTDQASAFQGSTLNVSLGIQRAAGFDGDVEVALVAPPQGISAPSPTLPAEFSAAAISVQIGADVPLGPSSLTLSAATGGEVVATDTLALSVGEAQPSSQDLIREALAAGTIDPGTSLLYRAYAVFGDDRLPAEFAGSGSRGEDLSLFDEIGAALGSLPPELEAELHPFTLRPAAPGSWFNAIPAPVAEGAAAGMLAAVDAAVLDSDCLDLEEYGGWISRRSDLWPVRIWFRCPDNTLTTARQVNKAIAIWLAAADRVWLPMTASTFMGEPLPDNLAGPDHVQWDIGDEAIDIYVTPNLGPNRADDVQSIGSDEGLSVKAAAPNSADPSRKSGYILVPAALTLNAGKGQAYLVHELMHVLQWAHNAVIATNAAGRGGFWWYADASADWAAAHFDRDTVTRPAVRGAWDAVYKNFDNDFQKSELPLNDPGDHRYSAFVWLHYLQQIHGPVNIRNLVGNSWRALEGKTQWDDGDVALDAVFDFENAFPAFSKRNLNQAFDPALPQSERYVSQDPGEFKDGVAPEHEDQDLAVQSADREYATLLPPMSTRYWKFKVTDGRARKVVFDLSDPDFGVTPMYVQAVYKTDTGWHHEIWNGELQAAFCFDEPGEALQELWLVASHHLLEPKGGTNLDVNFKVAVSSAPCKPSWAGTTTLTIQNPSDTRRFEANVRWIFDEVYTADPLQPNFYPEGTVTLVEWVHTGCSTYTATPSSATIESGDGLLIVDYTLPDPATGWEQGQTVWLARLDYACFGQDPAFQYLPVTASWWKSNPYGTPGAFTQLTDEGKTIEGSWAQTIGDTTFTQTYRYTRQDQ